MGSPELAVPTLEAVRASHDVALVVTQPDKPAGRGGKLAPPAVKVAAEAAGLEVWQPPTVKTPEAAERLRAVGADVAVVVAYGKILPPAVLEAPRHGCLNVHASLLPRYRGAAPITWAVVNGERESGVTIMQLDPGMDTGPMLLREAIPIGETETAGELGARIAPLGARLMVDALARLAAGTLVAEKQDDAAATLARILEKEDGRIDWTRLAPQVKDHVRGMDPWPGAFTTIDGEVLKLWRPRLSQGSGAPGAVLALDRDGLTVACGGGAVVFGEGQLPGRKRMPMAAMAQGRGIPLGTVLGR